jgi:hypothetical protein
MRLRRAGDRGTWGQKRPYRTGSRRTFSLGFWVGPERLMADLGVKHEAAPIKLQASLPMGARKLAKFCAAVDSDRRTREARPC